MTYLSVVHRIDSHHVGLSYQFFNKTRENMVHNPFVQVVVVSPPSDARDPSFSPDGRWLAYSSNESGILQVYVRAFPNTGGKWQVSNSGGVHPEWSRNGRELFFEALDNRIMVSAYTMTGDSFVAGKPCMWSEKKLADFGLVGVQNYDLAPDGKRIAAIMPAVAADAQPAQNQRLNRDVAIKVSAAQFSERFEREAKAIAALNHPNICTLYDVGPNYLVIEYI
jgi:WD40-like Beta Propeller Repeat